MYNKRSEKPQWAYELRICSSWLSSESIMCSGALCIKWRIDKIDTKDNNNWNNNINSNNIFFDDAWFSIDINRSNEFFENNCKGKDLLFETILTSIRLQN